MSLSATKPSVGIIVQARMGSSRLPGKIFKPLFDGESILGFLLKRLRQCKLPDRLVVATTTNPKDDLLVCWLAENDMDLYRGSEEDCLNRFTQTGKHFGFELVVRITSDCPLIVPEVVDEMVDYYLENRDRIDYLSNRQYTNFPEGLDVEIFTQKMLEMAEKKARKKQEREHINYYFLDRPTEFRIRYFTHTLGRDYSRFKLSIDTQEDLGRLRHLFENKGLPAQFTLNQLFSVLDES